MPADLQTMAERLRSVESTIPLLEAIRSVAEIAHRRAARAAPSVQAYAERVATLLSEAAGALGGGAVLEHVASGGPAALLVVSSDRGLCGGFNAAAVSRALDAIRAGAPAAGAELVCWGMKAERLSTSAGVSVLYTASLPSVALPAYETVEAMTLDLLGLLERHGFSRLYVVHNAPAGRFRYAPGLSQLIPPAVASSTQAIHPPRIRPDFDAPALIQHLLAEHAIAGLYQAVLESLVSEQLARMSAMRLAADNARRLADRLRFDYNLARQREETNSLLELINGYLVATEAPGDEGASDCPTGASSGGQ